MIERRSISVKDSDPKKTVGCFRAPIYWKTTVASGTVVPLEVESELAPTMTTCPASATAAARASKVPLLVKIAVTVGAAAKEETGEGATVEDEADEETAEEGADQALELEGADQALLVEASVDAASLLVLEGWASVVGAGADSSTARACSEPT